MSHGASSSSSLLSWSLYCESPCFRCHRTRAPPTTKNPPKHRLLFQISWRVFSRSCLWRDACIKGVGASGVKVRSRKSGNSGKNLKKISVREIRENHGVFSINQGKIFQIRGKNCDCFKFQPLLVFWRKFWGSVHKDTYLQVLPQRQKQEAIVLDQLFLVNRDPWDLVEKFSCFSKSGVLLVKNQGKPTLGWTEGIFVSSFLLMSLIRTKAATDCNNCKILHPHELLQCLQEELQDGSVTFLEETVWNQKKGMLKRGRKMWTLIVGRRIFVSLLQNLERKKKKQQTKRTCTQVLSEWSVC